MISDLELKHPTYFYCAAIVGLKTLIIVKHALCFVISKQFTD